MYLFTCNVFNDAVRNFDCVASDDQMTVNKEVERMLKEMVMTSFKVLFRLLSEKVRRSMTNLRQDSQCFSNAENPVMWKSHARRRRMHVIFEKF
jgi:hypothetical protein